MNRVIAVDFDGCLFERGDFPEFGEPIQSTIDRAKAEQSDGAKLVLWTCREGDALEAALNACSEAGLTFDAVNESTPDWIEAYGNAPRKIGATEYWDDRAVRMPPEKEVKRMLSVKAVSPGTEDLKLINGYAKTPLTEDQVYTFTVRLCDNEVDRDFERFTAESLEKLSELFIGKTGIFDHHWTADGQKARVYRTEVVREPDTTTAAGDEYCYLKAWAYLLRTDANADLIAEIEGGIKKEVSIGCSIGERVCSICGTTQDCDHLPGRMYEGKTCFRELRKPLDAYEFSFVAVPAQRNAGVMKKFTIEEGAPVMTMEELRAQYPELVTQLETDAAETARKAAETAAATAERQRLQEIDDIAPAIDAGLVKEAKYGAKRCTAAELSHRAVLQAAQQGKAFMAKAMEDYQQSGAEGVGAAPVTTEEETSPEKKEKTPEEKMKEARKTIKALLHPEDEED